MFLLISLEEQPATFSAKANPEWVAMAIKLGASPEKINALGWDTFLINNLVPVTLGNIVGGSVFVGLAYWLSYCYKK